ncbi:putative MFS transporter [Ascobolus immersus RN42]|uniref:Putative MFS transporter n=1 Tax=Ascobolus immersus RN42 TaxID=1160509 RepID=A0A3N4HNC2_ASCIM|nr:putative MFS transporter [Ascobolus immersus RN42]
MGLGILEPKSGHHVPGTTRMEEKNSVDSRGRDPNLKYCPHSKGDVVMVPQPSEDPNDPLNWTYLKRDMMLVILCMISILAATLGPILAANSFYLSTNVYHLIFTDIALLTGWHLFGVGIAGFIFVGTGTKYGRRHAYLFGALLIVVSSFWAAASKSYGSMLAARIVQGVGVAPFEALVNASVGDLYPVHKRGVRMALSNLALYGGAFITPVIVGVMTSTIGWRWTFYLVGILSAVCLPFLIFFVPETAFRRADHLNLDTALTSNRNSPEGSKTSLEMLPRSKEGSSSTSSSPVTATPLDPETHHSGANIPPKDTFLQSLRLFSKPLVDTSLIKLILRPFPLFLHPAILWGCLTQGTLIGWTVMIGVDLSVIFMFPPLWFTERQVGYLYGGAFVGAVLGFFLAGWLADWSARYMSRRNNGVYEPEFRIILVIPQAIFGIIGVFGFGWTAGDPARYGYWPATVFFGLEVCGMIIGAVASALYIVDAYRGVSVEAFTCMLMFKNFFSFALTFKAYDWLIKYKVWKTFKVAGAVQVVVCALSIPMYIWGKQLRAWLGEKGWFRAGEASKTMAMH